jgi:hypothetical protein
LGDIDCVREYRKGKQNKWNEPPASKGHLLSLQSPLSPCCAKEKEANSLRYRAMDAREAADETLSVMMKDRCGGMGSA